MNVPFLFHILPICGFYALLLCHKGTSVCGSFLLLSTIYWYTSFFFLGGPGPLHEIAVSAFSRNPLGRAFTFSFQSFQLTPCVSLLFGLMSSSFALFLSASVSLQSFHSYLSCTPLTSLWTLFLLDDGMPAHPFVNFLSYSPISFGWQPRFWHVPFMSSFQLCHASFCLKLVRFQFCS